MAVTLLEHPQRLTPLDIKPMTSSLQQQKMVIQLVDRNDILAIEQRDDDRQSLSPSHKTFVQKGSDKNEIRPESRLPTPGSADSAPVIGDSGSLVELNTPITVQFDPKG